MKLRELQDYFSRAVTSGSGPIADLERVFVSHGPLSARERIAIYNRGYFYRLLHALESVFSATRRVLGAAEFERVGLSYLGQYPSEHAAVERVGRRFATYLREHAETWHPVLDLAALEWARLCALVAPDPHARRSVTSIVGADFPRARLTFVPALQVLELDARALELFCDPELAARTNQLSAEGPKCGVAIWRTGFAVQHESLRRDEFMALQLAMRGATMSEVCAAFDSGAHERDVARAFSTLAAWFSRAWIEAEPE